MCEPNLSTKIGCITLRNPVLSASGCFSFGEEYEKLWEESSLDNSMYSLSALGAIVTKAIGLQARVGNPLPRICETPSGLINSIGLQNPGLKSYIEEILPRLYQVDIPIISNVVGFNTAEFGEVCQKLTRAINKSKVIAIELDLSCPNVEHGGASFANDIKLMTDVIRLARANTDLPLIAKLSPNVNNIVEFAQAAVDCGADCLTMCNTYIAMAIDIKTKRSRISRLTGGLSGAAIKPMTLYKVYQVHKALPNTPIIASGGIYNYIDALEYIIAGASAFQLGTGLWNDPLSPFKIINGITEYMKLHSILSLKSLIGSFKET